MKSKLVAAAAACALPAAHAHHGIANFDLNKDLELERHDHTRRLREPAFVAVLRSERRGRNDDAVALRDARLHRAAALRLVARDVRERHADHGHGVARSGRSDHVLSRHGDLPRRQQHRPLWTAGRKTGGAAARRQARAARERRPEHRRRLGRRAAGDDGPARPERHARAAQRSRRVPTRRRARGRAGVPRRSRHGDLARPQSRRRVLESTAERAAAHGGRRESDRRIRRLLERQSAPALRADQHPVRLDIRSGHQSDHANTDRDQAPLRLDGYRPNHSPRMPPSIRPVSRRAWRVTQLAGGRTTC